MELASDVTSNREAKTEQVLGMETPMTSHCVLQVVERGRVEWKMTIELTPLQSHKKTN